MKGDLLNFIKAISDPTRLRILKYLKKECCVGELWKKLDLSQNLTSHHLKILREHGLISAEKRGLRMVYRLNENTLKKKLKQLNDYMS
jgi:DNA-binding transcriptional ArsR family regulator